MSKCYSACKRIHTYECSIPAKQSHQTLTNPTALQCGHNATSTDSVWNSSTAFRSTTVSLAYKVIKGSPGTPCNLHGTPSRASKQFEVVWRSNQSDSIEALLVGLLLQLTAWCSARLHTSVQEAKYDLQSSHADLKYTHSEVMSFIRSQNTFPSWPQRSTLLVRVIGPAWARLPNGEWTTCLLFRLLVPWIILQCGTKTNLMRLAFKVH